MCTGEVRRLLIPADLGKLVIKMREKMEYIIITILL